ncbi:multiple banded antigen [Ureaplasma urealyticum serovar 2 str. ATCC 27814]|nr:multiple banded antigen [Ureaplasma urealyticum serovar 2 str. ATCC 27814]
MKVLGIVFLFATNSDKTSFYDVYNITNFDKLSKIKKDALKNLNFNVAITDSNKKTTHQSTVGLIKDNKVYIKLPRELKKGEQLSIINKEGILNPIGQVLTIEPKYEVADLETKVDNVVVDKIEFSNQSDFKTKEVRVKVSFKHPYL